MKNKLLHIIPRPKKVILEGGEDNYKEYAALPHIVSVPEFEKYVPAFKLNVSKLHGIDLLEGVGGISLNIDPDLSGEKYRIECAEDGIKLYASNADGIVNALSTLHQIISNKDGKLCYPAYTIEDYPDSSFRALMVHLPTHLEKFENIFHYIDVCYLNKIKYIHLNQTITTKSFPKINEGGKGLSIEQIEIIRKYCDERNVEIIPAIQVPGHTGYLANAYPELFCHTAITGSPRKDTLCVGKPKALDSVRQIIADVMELFPNSRYFHIGGDEAELSGWENCVDCRRYMDEHGIKSAKELYSHCIKIITDMVLDMGKIPVVWEGFPKEGSEGISRKVVVTAWESLYHLPNELIEEGFTVTNSSWMPLYVVAPNSYHAQFVPGGRWYPKDILCDWNVYTWKNWWEKSYAYNNPIVVEPTDQVIGGTYCLWASTYAQDINTVKENLPAVSERLWNVDSTLLIEEFELASPNLIELASKIK